MTRKKNILIVSQAKVSYTETFIRAHIEKLDGKIFCLYGWNLDFKTDDNIPLAQLYAPKTNLVNKFETLLPQYFYFRLKQKRKKHSTKEALINRYIKDNNIDLVFAEYGTSGGFIAPVCAELQVPLIVHFHGIDASKYELINEFKSKYLEMFKHATYIIAVSHRMANDIINMGCPKEKVVYNPYGPNEDFNAVSINYDSNNIIAIGHQNFKKAPYLTLLAFEKVLEQKPELRLHFVGGGELLEISKNIAIALHIEDKVIFHGKKSREELIPIIKEAFLFVQHSIIAMDGNSEGTPVAILEAMFSGLPIISTIHAGIPDVVVDGTTGLLVKELDIDHMASSILELANDRAKAKKMGENGQKRAHENFTMERHITKLDKLIEQAIDLKEA